MLAVLQRLVVLLPDAWEERRDRGLAWAALGQPDAAAEDLRAYLEHCPEAKDREAMRRELDALRPDRPRLH